MNAISVIGIVFYILSMGGLFWWQEKKIRSQYQYITLLEGMVLHLSLHRDILMFIEDKQGELEEENEG